MSCDLVRERLDAFHDGEIAGSEAASIVLHLASCAECGAYSERREALRLRVRSAVRNVDAPADLGYKVQSTIARGDAGRKWISTALAIAAALVIAAGAFYFRPVSGPPKQEAAAADDTDQVAPVMRIGLRQHVHCGVLREYPKEAPTLLELARAEGANAGLINAVESYAPEGMHVVMAHRCSYEGRTYTHVIARSEGHLMSLLITKREEGDVLAQHLKPVANELDTPIFAADSAKYSIDAFETSGYLVYLVSDLDDAQNLAALKAMTPQVRAALL